MKRLALVLVLLAACVSPPQGSTGYIVTRVVDGDTIVVSTGEKVRLIGVDTPETHKPGTPVQCYGPEAALHTASLLHAGQGVHLVFDRDRLDRYGRLLAYVYRDGDNLFVNLDLVAGGWARVLTVAPNVAHESEFVRAAAVARAAGLGLWGACPP